MPARATEQEGAWHGKGTSCYGTVSGICSVLLIQLWYQRQCLRTTRLQPKSDENLMDFPTNSILHRTFQLSTRLGQGTCFTYDYYNKRYLVTASHCIPDGYPGDTAEVYIRTDLGEEPMNVTVLGRTDSTLDLVVLTPHIAVHSHNYPLDPPPDLVTVGQEVYFCGFPFGLATQSWTLPDAHQYPTCLVKHAIISGFDPFKTWILDGHSNPGFSGGPVVIMDGVIPKIIGVVTARRNESVDLTSNGKPTGFHTVANAGILFATQFSHALNIIHRNPRGLPLTITPHASGATT